jgi:hypothetical protein
MKKKRIVTWLNKPPNPSKPRAKKKIPTPTNVVPDDIVPYLNVGAMFYVEIDTTKFPRAKGLMCWNGLASMDADVRGVLVIVFDPTRPVNVVNGSIAVYAGTVRVPIRNNRTKQTLQKVYHSFIIDGSRYAVSDMSFMRPVT